MCTGERQRRRALVAGRASWRAPRPGHDQPGIGMGWGFSGRKSPRLHVVKQERPRVTAVLCRGCIRSAASRAPSRHLATLAGFPRVSCERSSEKDRSGHLGPRATYWETQGGVRRRDWAIERVDCVREPPERRSVDPTSYPEDGPGILRGVLAELPCRRPFDRVRG